MSIGLKIWVPATILSALLGALVVMSPNIALGVIAVVAFAVIVIKVPNALIYLTLTLATITLPAAVPTSFSAGPITVKAYEPLLIAAVIYVAYRYRRRAPSGLIYFASLVGCWSAAGLLAGHDASKIIYDIRNLVMLVCACYIAYKVSGTEVPRKLLIWIRGILWISAILSVVSSVTSLPLSGRSEEAALPVSGSSAADSALRLLTPGTHLALAVLCVLAVLIITRRCAIRDVMSYLLPALILVFISFSRNSILAVGVAVVFALVGLRSVQGIGRTFGYGLATAGGFWLISAASSTLGDQPLAAWISKQFSGFSERVLGGLTSDTLAVDNSAQFRFQMENALLIPKISESPFLGYGFGFAYKLPQGVPGSFTAEYAPYYAHNFYLWILAKAGIIGLCIFLYFALKPILTVLKRQEPAALALAGATMALLATSFVAPIPLGSPTALILGALLGGCYSACGGPSESLTPHSGRYALSPPMLAA